jgi:hypothetical protein
MRAVPGAGVEPKIVNGTASDESQDSVVLVMHYEALAKGGGAASGCSGTLLTPRLVLTARHCVSVTDEGAVCNSKGKPIEGGAVSSDYTPNSIYVFGGKDRPDFIGGTARPSRGQDIFTTGANTICDNDIALVLLDRPVEGGKIAPIVLDTGAAQGERVTVVGWGITETEPNPATRRQRADVQVTDIGPSGELGPAEFRTGEGPCHGDSGGPAFAASGAVLGALSRGGNGTDAAGAEACLEARNVFSSTAAHADLIRAAYEKAGQVPWLEGEPNPTLGKLGATCSFDTECQSNVCDAAGVACSQDCAIEACPVGFECALREQRKLCSAIAPSEEGCALAGKPANAAVPGAAIGCALAVLFSRARRKK